MNKLTMCFYRCKDLAAKEVQAQEFIDRVAELTGYHTPKCYDIVIHETHAEFNLNKSQ